MTCTPGSDNDPSEPRPQDAPFTKDRHGWSRKLHKVKVHRFRGLSQDQPVLLDVFPLLLFTATQTPQMTGQPTRASEQLSGINDDLGTIQSPHPTPGLLQSRQRTQQNQGQEGALLFQEESPLVPNPIHLGHRRLGLDNPACAEKNISGHQCILMPNKHPKLYIQCRLQGRQTPKRRTVVTRTIIYARAGASGTFTQQTT